MELFDGRDFVEETLVAEVVLRDGAGPVVEAGEKGVAGEAEQVASSARTAARNASGGSAARSGRVAPRTIAVRAMWPSGARPGKSDDEKRRRGGCAFRRRG